MPQLSKPGSRPGAVRLPRQELAQLFDEAVALYLRLNAFAGLIYQRGDVSGPRRTVLMALDRSGPQTVAHMARTRFQSRQRIQPLVNALVAEGLLQPVDNPVHRRSPLLQITERGKAVVNEIVKTEGALRSCLHLEVSSKKVAEAAHVVRQVRLALDHPSTMQATRRLLRRHRRKKRSSPRRKN